MFFTISDLEREMVRAIRVWTADMRFKSPTDRGAVPVPLSVFTGFIPSYQAGPTAVEQIPKAPSIAVKIADGHYRRQQGDATLNMAILVWDDSLTRTGYLDVLNVINRVANGMLETVMLSQAFVLLQDTVGEESITFDLIEDANIDFFPYSLGMMTAKYGLMSPSIDKAPYNDVGPDTMTWIGPSGTGQDGTVHSGGIADPVSNPAPPPSDSDLFGI